MEKIKNKFSMAMKKFAGGAKKFIFKVGYNFKQFGFFMAKIWKHPKGKIGLIIVTLVSLVAIFAPLLTPYGPYDFNVTNALQKPSAEHLLGTDKNGVDIMSQLLHGARVSLSIGIITGLSVTLFGAIMGIIAGYFGKVASSIILNVINVLMVIPTLPLMIMLNKISSSYVMMVFVFVAFGWAGMARMIRSQVLSIKNMNYVKQAELDGASRWYIMTKHILPGISHLLIMSCALSCAGFMIAEAGLSFLGIGDPSTISWGKILVGAQESAFTAELWVWVLAPGVALFIIVTGFMFVGYSLEDIFNPRIKLQNDIYKQFGKLQSKIIEDEFAKMEDMSEQQALIILKEYNENKEKAL